MVAAGPFVHDAGAGERRARRTWRAAYVVGLPPQAPACPEVTDIRQHATTGDFRFASSRRRSGAASCSASSSPGDSTRSPGDTITLVCLGKGEINAVTGQPVPLDDASSR